MNFKEAVQKTPQIVNYLQAGLQALGGNSSKIIVNTTRDLKGSVDIDTCLKNDYPNSPRWDYVFGYKDKVFYVEIHQGKTSEVDSIILKFNWLKQWLKSSANNLEQLMDRSFYHWISTKGTASIAKGSRHRRRLDQKGISGPSAVLRIER